MTAGPVARVILVLLIGRLVVFGAAIAAETLDQPAAGATNAPVIVEGRTSDLPLFKSLGSWDGFYYIDIARNGYSADPVNASYSNTVFFPLYPAAIRVAHDLTGLDWAVVGVLISNAAFVGACLMIALLTARITSSAGLVTVGLLSLAPGSTAFSMAYSESLFLLLSASAFWLVERGNVRAGAACCALAAACRPTGILLVLPLALRVARDAARRTGIATIVAAGFIGLAAVLAIQWLAVGDPFAFVHAQAAWTNQFDQPAGGSGRVSPGPDDLASLGVTVGYIAIAVFVAYVAAASIQFVRGRPRAYGLYALLGIIGVLALGRLASAERYAAVLFPIFWPAERLRRPAIIGLAIVSGVLLAGMSFLSFRLDVAP